MTPITWQCEVCRRRRPDRFIGVFKLDMSEPLGLPVGTMTRLVNRCNDRRMCRRRAQTIAHAGLMMILRGRKAREVACADS